MAQLRVYTSAPSVFSFADGKFVFDASRKLLEIRSKGGDSITVEVGQVNVGSIFEVASATPTEVNLRWSETHTDLLLSLSVSPDGQLTSLELAWKNLFSSALTTLEDRVCMQGAHWYGGAELYNQKWPIDPVQQAMAPFVTNDIFKNTYGPVAERYLLASNCVAVTVDDTVPLWMAMDGDHVTLRSQYKDSIYANCADLATATPYLVYRIHVPSKDDTSLKSFHLGVLNNCFGKPKGVPDPLIFSDPIWSTWARYKKLINQELVLKYATEIQSRGFKGCQIEIDDNWETSYGDHVMDPKKFPDPQAMIKQLTSMGFRATLWVHPFANLDSKTALDPSNEKYWVKGSDGKPAKTNWWNGDAFIVDTTNKDAADWFVNRLTDLRQNTGVLSFKFDAGETNWLPSVFRLSEVSYPNQFSEVYARTCTRLGSSIEVRVGSKSQDLPIFVRILDRDSRWGLDNGLRSVITCVLHFGLLGFPFVLPDMVGGNAYGDNVFPDRELFIRWMQVNALLPSIQFSIVPWDYDDQVVEIGKRMMELRRKYTPTLLALAQEATVTGAPIIRPIWWVDESEQALTCDSQFLLGDDLLVAPVLDPGATSREVYLPPGRWTAPDASTHSGPSTITVNAPLDQLPIFIRTT